MQHIAEDFSLFQFKGDRRNVRAAVACGFPLQRTPISRLVCSSLPKDFKACITEVVLSCHPSFHLMCSLLKGAVTHLVRHFIMEKMEKQDEKLASLIAWNASCFVDMFESIDACSLTIGILHDCCTQDSPWLFKRVHRRRAAYTSSLSVIVSVRSV